MVSKKYVGDYRLENVLDRRGKLKTVPVYRGPLFRFKQEESVVKRAKVRCIVFTAAATISLFATLIIRAELLQIIYVVMPLILCILPVSLLWMGNYNLLTVGKTVRRDQNDRIHNRFAGWSIVLLILSAMSLIGQITAYLKHAATGSIPITVSTVVIIVCAVLIFITKKDLEMRECPPEG